MLTVSLLYTPNKELQDELKLSDEQVKKLAAHRDKWLSEYTSLRASDRAAKGEELSGANDKVLAEILKPEQVERLRQLTLQAVEKEYDGRALRYPEVAAALRLSEEQQTKARTEPVAAVLTRDQQAQWQALKGAPFEGALQPDFAGVFGRQFPALPPNARYVFARSVQEEVKLTDEQRARVRGLRERWAEAIGAGPGLNDERLRQAEETVKEIEAAIDELLQAEQKTRLAQIQVQMALRLRSEGAAFTLADVAAALKLTEEQRKKITALRKQRQEELAAVYLTGEDSEAIATKAAAYRKESRAELEKVLDAGQQARLKALIGKPFKGTIALAGFGSPVGARLRPLSLVVAGIRFAEAKELHDELKLSADQAKKLAQAVSEFRDEVQSLPVGATDEESLKKRAELIKTTEQAVANSLTADQARRLKQIALQQFTVPLGGFDTRNLPRYPAVVEALKLTAAQKEELLEGAELDRVLTPDQQTKWREMLGAPFKATLNPLPLGAPRRPPLPPALAYLEQGPVQDELKLSVEQRKQLKELEPRWQDATKYLPPQRGPGDPGDDYRAKLAEATKDIDKAIAGVLEPKQQRRLREIVWQQQEKEGVDALLTTEGVVEALALTAEQQKQIRGIAENAARVEQLVVNDTALEALGPERGLRNQTLEKLSQATDDKLAGLLTRDQKVKLQEMLGAPFKGELQPASGDGVGGFVGPALGGGLNLSGFAPP
jgi:hypothetical protein